MSKPRSKIKLRIPTYSIPRIKWRRAIHAVAAQVCKEHSLHYRESDRLELQIILYQEDAKLAIHDLDNRLKDIMDALQGRAGGSKAKPTLPPIIPNDRQIYRVLIEKNNPPKQSRGLGRITIRRYRAGD
jgi:Holliday junction resolvase RusA-like endonuclease